MRCYCVTHAGFRSGVNDSDQIQSAMRIISNRNGYRDHEEYLRMESEDVHDSADLEGSRRRFTETMKSTPQQAVDFFYADDSALDVFSDDQRLLQSLIITFASATAVTNPFITLNKSQSHQKVCHPLSARVDGTKVEVV